MTEPVVVQALPFRVKVVRWWASKLNLMAIWSLVELALPILLLTDFSALGFGVKTAAWIVLVVKILNVATTITLKNTSSSVVGTKDEVASTQP